MVLTFIILVVIYNNLNPGHLAAIWLCNFDILMFLWRAKGKLDEELVGKVFKSCFQQFDMNHKLQSWKAKIFMNCFIQSYQLIFQ